MTSTALPVRAGVGIVDITPAVGTLIAGGLRPRTSTGIASPLHAKALLIQAGGCKVGFVALDLAVLPKEPIAEALGIVESKTRMAPGNVMVACTHTHNGPYTGPIFGSEEGLDPDYMAALPASIAEAVVSADADLRPAELGVGDGEETGIQHYRRVRLRDGGVTNTWLAPDPEQVVGPAGEVDPQVGVLLVRSPADGVIAALTNFTCHVNAGVGDACLIHGSYASFLAEALEGKIGGRSIFLPGACGNINPSASAQEMGRVLAEDVVKIVGGIRTSGEACLAARKVEIELPLRDFSKLRIDAIRRTWPSGEDVFVREWKLLHEAGEKSVRTCLQVIAVSNAAYVGIPGELFVELGREIKRRSPFEHTYIVELANDYIGYIPTRRAFDEGGYETLDARSSKVAPEAGEMIVEESLKLLEAVKKELPAHRD